MFKKRPKNEILKRCKSDDRTALRLRYNPYYRTISKTEGVFVELDGRRLIMMSSNEYLGLSTHPRVVEAVGQAVRTWGSSPCGSRLANGSRSYHQAFEEKLADFVGKEACHIFAAGYLACMASVSGLTGRQDAIFVDQSIHSALWDGIRLAHAEIERFSHNRPESLEELLNRHADTEGKLIVVDGVYSMEGHIAPVVELVELAERHGAFLVVDDAHGFGILGQNGRGTCNHFGVTDRVNLIAGSFSKSLASTGGFVAGDRSVIEYLRTHSKQIIFSAAIGAPACAAASASLDVLQEEPQHLERLWERTRFFRGLLESRGIDYWDSPTPAIPIVIGDTMKAYRVWNHLLKKGFFTVMSISPGVPAGKDLLRVAVTAGHEESHLEQFVDALEAGIKG